MMFGREVHMPIDLIYGVHSPNSKLSRPEYKDQLNSRMDKVHKVVRDRLVHAAAQQKRRYDLTILPRNTPRHPVSVSSSVERVERTFPARSQTVMTHSSTITSAMQSEATLQQITALLDDQMPDFAELLNEPRTPSPMKRLRNEINIPVLSPSLIVPSDILFSKYLESVSPEPFKDPMTYSPSDRPFILLAETPVPSDFTHTNPPLSPEPPTPTDYSPLDLSKIISPVNVVSTQLTSIDNNENNVPIDLSKRTSTPLLTPSPIPLPSPSQLSIPSPPPLSTPSTELPLDLTVNGKQNTEPAEIDCTLPTNKWSNLKEIEVDHTDKIYNDLSLDPRLFFAGAPSSYLKHPLAKTLREQINLCRRTRASRYQIRLIPIGTSRIMKEERCYLPDGTVLELRDIWTSNTTEE
ncbi:unnamed protein product [Mytilus coruscus]|uniref:Uncharacterized protein n=1 Tax=Mytilus coruscus TaxID=42192 RepID=A0A6J8DT48_MYTCO|nr:unnamed protein product [Mytilus coruscus]